MQEEERRDSRRVPCRIGLSLHDGPGDHQVLTYALDLSQTGAFIAAVRELPAGTPVRFDFDGGGGRIEGVVVRSGRSALALDPGLAERGIGVRFTHIDPAARAVLAVL
jgi:hypothetical protein